MPFGGGREGLSEESPSRPLQTSPTLPKDVHKWTHTWLRLRNGLFFNASSPTVPFSFLPAFTGDARRIAAVRFA